MTGVLSVQVHPDRVYLDNFPDPVLKAIDDATSYQHRTSEGFSDQGAKYNRVDAEQVWDGWIRFLNTPKTMLPWLPTGLRDIALGVAHHFGFQPIVNDLRQAPEPDPYFLDRYAEPIPLWAHQEACASAMVSSFDGVAEMPPRAGKTRTMFEVVRRLGLRTLWVAPTSSIVDQTIKAGRAFFDDHDVIQVASASQNDAREALITVCTAATVFRLKPEFFASRQMLVCDEAHHYLASKGWGSFLIKSTPHIAHRKGMTGTFFRSSGDDLSMHAFLSRTLFRISSSELEAGGYLVPCYATFVGLERPKVRTKGRTFNAPNGHGTLGIAKHGFRNDVVASVAKHLSNTGRTVLILVWTKQQGYEIQKRLEPMFPAASPTQTVKPVEFVSTDRPKHVIRDVLDSFREHGNVRVLIGTSMVGEGTDLPPADALVYAAGGKAAVALTQAWYRVITKTEEKQYSVIVDFADCHHKKLKVHAQHRWHVMSQDPIFRMSYCDSLDEFQNWCQHLAPWTP